MHEINILNHTIVTIDEKKLDHVLIADDDNIDLNQNAPVQIALNNPNKYVISKSRFGGRFWAVSINN